MKCKQPRPEFKLGSPGSFLTTITITLHAPPKYLLYILFTVFPLSTSWLVRIHIDDRGNHLRRSSVVFLPIINLIPLNVSMLQWYSWLSKQTVNNRLLSSPSTCHFNGKVQTIVVNDASNGCLKSMILKIGVLHRDEFFGAHRPSYDKQKQKQDLHFLFQVEELYCELNYHG